MSSNSEFVRSEVPRPGLTSISARQFLMQAFPTVTTWTLWEPHHSFCQKIVSRADQDKGTIGDWRWEVEGCHYPSVFFLRSSSLKNEGVRLTSSNWAGALRIVSPRNEQFLLFSFLHSTGETGSLYYISTADKDLIEKFSEAVYRCYRKENTDDKIEIDITNGHNIYINPVSEERVFLPTAMQADIEQQVFSFFRDQKDFTSFHIPVRRGFLFVGPPGCGKTMLIRNLVRQCYAQFKLRFWSVTIERNTDEKDVARLFRTAADYAPGMIILEDLDSLTNNSNISRSALLNQLDGLKPREGILVIGTTNNPQDVDPALIHRPSRFDRVWLFETPDSTLRKQYLEATLKDVSSNLIAELVAKTDDWSFAYLNELRTTAAILAIQDRKTVLERTHVTAAFKLLTAQFRSGQKCYASKNKPNNLGFAGE